MKTHSQVRQNPAIQQYLLLTPRTHTLNVEPSTTRWLVLVELVTIEFHEATIIVLCFLQPVLQARRQPGDHGDDLVLWERGVLSEFLLSNQSAASYDPSGPETQQSFRPKEEVEGLQCVPVQLDGSAYGHGSHCPAVPIKRRALPAKV